MVTIRCRSAKALQMARTVRSVTSMIVVIARRGPFRSRAPFAATTFAPWHEHEEDD